jgi:DMSO/TMAO reductase YedYZ molybdopterin-dependent catalytic subunit
MDVRESLPIHAVPAADRERADRAMLRIDGLVARPIELSQADLARLPRSILDEPFVCEDGWSVPRMRWAGVRLVDILALAGPLAAACYVRAGAGQWVVPVPLEQAAAALVCDELNDGEALAVEHRALAAGGLRRCLLHQRHVAHSAGPHG